MEREVIGWNDFVEDWDMRSDCKFFGMSINYDMIGNRVPEEEKKSNYSDGANQMGIFSLS